MLFRETAAIKEWITTLHEDRIKRIFELRYLDGLSWESVALRVYGRACGDAARKRVVRFFEEKDLNVRFCCDIMCNEKL